MKQTAFIQLRILYTAKLIISITSTNCKKQLMVLTTNVVTLYS